jgi:hypothetical protein
MIFLGLLILIDIFLLPDIPMEKTQTMSNYSSTPHKRENQISSASSIPHRGEEAFVWCKLFIETRLSSPSTASFSSLFNSTITSVGIGSYRVTGYVDAQNAFGAKIRNSYTCVVRRDGGDWILESLSLY